MSRALCTLNKVCSGLAAGFCCAAGCCVMISTDIICRILFSIFLAMDTMAFRTMAGALCTNASSCSIAYPVTLLVSLLIRLVITEVS